MDKDVPGYIWDMKTASEDNPNILYDEPRSNVIDLYVRRLRRKLQDWTEAARWLSFRRSFSLRPSIL